MQSADEIVKAGLQVWQRN